MFKQVFGKKPDISHPIANRTNTVRDEPVSRLQHLSMEHMFAEMRTIAADPSKSLLPDHEIRALTEEHSNGLKQCLKNLNRNIGQQLIGSEVDCLTSVSLLPPETWNSPFGDFLTQVCAFYPCHPMNVWVLPTTERASLILNLPLAQKLKTDPRIASHFIAEIFGKLTNYVNSVKPRIANGDVNALEDMPKQKKLTSWRVIQLAHQIGESTYGNEAMVKHEQVFGASLGWPKNMLELLRHQY